MASILLSEGPLRVAISPEKGASILSMTFDHPDGVRREVISRAIAAEDPLAKPPCFIMAPWTNRVDRAAFVFQGQKYQLRPSSADGSAIHGDVRSRAFAIVDRSPLSARLRFESRGQGGEAVNFPWAFACEARYEIIDSTLEAKITIENQDSRPMPAGCGLHPYFPRFFAGGTKRVRMLVPVSGRYPSVRNIPVAASRMDAVCRGLRSGVRAAGVLDDVFSGFSTRAVLEWDYRLEIEASQNFGHVVVYVPRGKSGDEEPFIAVEPVTMVNDGFNLMARGERGTGVVVLQPGERLETTTRFTCFA
ncbi:MAG: hypothetical protein K2X32_14970 [Phycisphaerales bacterium]|nr:hypothetical protein [Phycisphaerales bacterium]